MSMSFEIIVALFLLNTRLEYLNCYDEYMEIINEPYFIDKSMLIQNFIKSKMKARVVLAPARFGKTTNLRMLESFFQITWDKDGNRTDPKRTTIFKTFKKLNIGNTPGFEDNIGKYNVLYFNFVGLKNFASYKSFLTQFRAVIHESFEKWDWLSKKANFDDRDKVSWEFCLKPTDDFPAENLKTCGGELIRLLKKHTKSPCIILIDEYDTPRHFILTSNTDALNDADEIGKIGDFLTWFITSLIKNIDVHKAFLTGIIRISATNDRKGDSLNIKSVFEDRYLLRYYGFHQAEIDTLSERYNLSPATRLLMSHYFGGHRAYFDDKIEIYNPYAVVEYLSDGMPENVMDIKFSSAYTTIPHLKPFTRLIRPAMMGSVILESLGSEGISEGEFLEGITDNMLAEFKQFAFRRRSQTPDRENLFFQYLLENGVYTHKMSSDGKTKNLVVPNWIIKQHIQDEVLKKEYFKTLWHHTEMEVNNFTEAVKELENSAESLTRFTEASAMLFSRVKNPQSELEMAAPVFSYVSSGIEEFSGEIFIPSKVQRSNDDLFARRSDKTGVIIVFKLGTKDVGNFGDHESNKPPESDTLLRKAVERDYSQLYKNYPMKNRILIGMYLNKTHLGCSLLYNSGDVTVDIITADPKERGPIEYRVDKKKRENSRNIDEDRQPIADPNIIEI